LLLQENHQNNNAIIIDETGLGQTVHIIGCKSSVVQIKGKVNAINLGEYEGVWIVRGVLFLTCCWMLVSCTKTSVLLDSTVSSLSITSSPSFTVQILGVVPTILVDASDGGQIYLSEQSLGAEIVTAKTSAINVSLPKPGGEEGEFVERPVPEQMKTVVKDGKLVTTVLEHAG
jgi:adenylyl cyclase-associated protein